MSIPAIAAPYLAATGLLGSAGAVKLVRPANTKNALQAAGLPSHLLVVRAGALTEMAVAVSAIARPGLATGLLVAASYMAFAGFIALAMSRGWVIASCGCFGRPDTPPARAHLLLNLAAAGCAAWWALAPPSSLGAALDHQPWAGLPLALVTAVIGYLGYLVFTNPLGAARR